MGTNLNKTLTILKTNCAFIFASNWYGEDKLSFYVGIIGSNETLQVWWTNGLPLSVSHSHPHNRS